MDEKLLQRILRLIERTGDKVIVVNPESGKAHVVLPLSAYEKMAESRASLLDLVDGEGDLCDEFNGDDLPAVRGQRDLREQVILGDDDDVLSAEEINAIEREAVAEAEKEIAEEKLQKQEKTFTVEEINQKLAEESEKISINPMPIEAVEDTENDDQYYLEPIE